MERMKGIKFNLNSDRNPAGEVTVQSGNRWLDVYEAPGRNTLRFAINELSRLSRDWGGYFIVSGTQLIPGVVGMFTLFLNHYGADDDQSNTEIDSLINHNPNGNRFGVSDVRFNTFLDYARTVTDPPHVNTYRFSTFVQEHIVRNVSQVDQLVDFLMDLVHAPSNDSEYDCTGILTGGELEKYCYYRYYHCYDYYYYDYYYY
nr:hypothetical protein BaRGS_011208 [Batillaria attramentaria]